MKIQQQKHTFFSILRKTFTVLAAAASLSALPCHAWVNIEAVPVGDVGNPDDKVTGLGRVDYDYCIGKYEVTLAQYTEFLNAVAKTDSYRLYVGWMTLNANTSGISRQGTNGSYSYQVIGDGNRPVAYVSWFDAARFVNWLNHGQPQGNQGPATTETGAYTLNGAQSGIVLRNTNCNYSLPSESEWYKAAFYQPAALGGDADGYWLYPTASNNQPNSRNGSTTDANSANFYRNDGIDNGFNGGYAVNNATTLPEGSAILPVGSFTLAKSYYGTFDQAGNVDEWNEAVVGTSRGLRGGTWIINGTIEDAHMRAIDTRSTLPSIETSAAGFRVVVKKPEVYLNATQANGNLVLSWAGNYVLESTTNCPSMSAAALQTTMSAAALQTNWTRHPMPQTNCLVCPVDPNVPARFFRLVKP